MYPHTYRVYVTHLCNIYLIYVIYTYISNVTTSLLFYLIFVFKYIPCKFFFQDYFKHLNRFSNMHQNVCLFKLYISILLDS